MSAAREHSALYPIRAVSRLTGIAIDTLRAWERRYGAVTPVRDDRGRLYTDADVARLRLINGAVAAGHSIGRIARLDQDELARLAAGPPGSTEPAPPPDPAPLRDAIARFDSESVDQEFSRLAAVLPPLQLVRDVLLPLLRDVGDAWNRRPGGIAQEHLITSTMRHLLGSSLRVYARRDPRVRLLFATPSGDRHEVGILAAAMLAASSGVSVSYLGPDLPAGEIVEAAKGSGAQALVLGLTLVDRSANRAEEIRTIVRDLPSRTELWAGGPATARHARLLGMRGTVLPDLDAYQLQVARIAAQSA